MESEDHKLFSKPTYQWYVVILLTTVYEFNFIDRNILAILGQSIKDDLMISDTALGFWAALHLPFSIRLWAFRLRGLRIENRAKQCLPSVWRSGAG